MGGAGERAEVEHGAVREDSEDAGGGCIIKADGGIIHRRSDTTSI